MWISRDEGRSWKKDRQLTSSSERNHTYVRRPLSAHQELFAQWGYGHGRKSSRSQRYIANKQGEVFCLPREMDADFVTPECVTDSSNR